MFVKYLIAFIVFRLQNGNNCLAATITFYIEDKNEKHLNNNSNILVINKPKIDLQKHDSIFMENDDQNNASNPVVLPPEIYNYENRAVVNNKSEKINYDSKLIETIPTNANHANLTYLRDKEMKSLFYENIGQENKASEDSKHSNGTNPADLILENFEDGINKSDKINHVSNLNNESPVVASSRISDFSDTTEDFFQEPVIRSKDQNGTAIDEIIIQDSVYPFEYYEPEYIVVPDLPRKSRQLSNNTDGDLSKPIEAPVTNADQSSTELKTAENNNTSNSETVFKNKTVSSTIKTDQTSKAGPVFLGKAIDAFSDADMSFGADPIPLSSENFPVFEKCCKCVSTTTTTTTTPTTILGRMADDCPCRGRSVDDMAVASSNIFSNFAKGVALPSSLPAASPTPILKPEVGFAESLIDTLRSAGAIELKNAKEREAARALEEAKKKAEEEKEKSQKDSKTSPALKLSLPGKLSAPRPLIVKPKVINSRNSFGDSDYAGSESIPSVIVQPDYLMGRPGTLRRGVPGPIYIGLPAVRKPMLSRTSTSPLRMPSRAIAKPTSPVLSSVARRPLQSTASRAAGSILGSAAPTKSEVPEDRSRRLLTAIRDALGLDKNHQYKCKIIINED